MDTGDVITFQAPECLWEAGDISVLSVVGKEVGESLRLLGSAFLANAELD